MTGPALDLVERAAASALPPDPVAAWQRSGAVERLRVFFDERCRWAGTHNLSGPRALDDPWGPDLIDGLAVALISPLEQMLVDVGAGSGIPGLVVACVQPDRPIVLVEPIAKRAAFLRSVVSRLGVRRVRVERARWPLDGLAASTEGADIVSRAVVDPADWPELAAKGGDIVGGVIRLLAARRPPCELDGFSRAAALDYDLGSSGPRRVERWARGSSG